MTRHRDSHIRQQLTSLISPQLIRRRARKLGVVKRQRKVDVVALVYTLILGFGGGEQRTLAALRRAYAVATGTQLARSAFRDRFTPELAELMRQLTFMAFERLGNANTRLGITLWAFANVFIADGSLVRLNDALQAEFPSVWTNHTKASAKLHVVIDAGTRTPKLLQLAPGSTHDLSLMSVGPWCRHGLFLFDLAYYQGKLFRKITDAGGHFLCRVKKDANFKILSASRAAWVGQRHRQVIANAQGKDFEVEVDYAYRHLDDRNYDWHHLRLRMIGHWDRSNNRHRLYLTNAARHQLSAKSVGAVYALRWEIELLFRELKSLMRLDHMPSGNKAASECLIYASLLALAFSRKLHSSMAKGRANLRRIFDPFPIDRWTAVFRSITAPLLDLLLAPTRRRFALGKRLRNLLLWEARDPNRKRLLLAGRAQTGILQAELGGR